MEFFLFKNFFCSVQFMYKEGTSIEEQMFVSLTKFTFAGQPWVWPPWLEQVEAGWEVKYLTTWNTWWNSWWNTWPFGFSTTWPFYLMYLTIWWETYLTFSLNLQVLYLTRVGLLCRVGWYRQRKSCRAVHARSSGQRRSLKTHCCITFIFLCWFWILPFISDPWSSLLLWFPSCHWEYP